MKKLLQKAMMYIIICISFTTSNYLNAQCAYRVEMFKNSLPTGIHGWEGAQIMFMNDNNQVLGTCSLSDDVDEGVAEFEFPKEHITCYWFSGEDDYWINFDIYDYNNELFFSGWPAGFENQVFLEFTPDCSDDTPTACENFTATGSIDSFESFLTWTNPSLTIGGEPTTLTEIIILRDEEQIFSIENPEPGAEISWTDNTVPLAGEHYYSVIPVNETGVGPTVTDVDTVGLYHVMPLSGYETITTCVGFVRNMADYLGLYFTNNDAVLTIKPAVDGEYVHIEGFHYIYDGTYGGDKDHLCIYDGEGVDGPLLADYTDSCFDEKDDSKDTKIDVTSMTGALTIHFKTGVMGGCRGFNIFSSCTDVAGSNEITTVERVKIYPNPVDGILHIEGENLGVIDIYDITGRKAGSYENVNVIDMSDYKSGLYVVRAQGFSERIVVR
ncbi:MAG: T9SS type A sorting domain-containing protein [Candidatus Limimorpha sp.]